MLDEISDEGQEAGDKKGKEKGKDKKGSSSALDSAVDEDGNPIKKKEKPGRLILPKNNKKEVIPPPVEPKSLQQKTIFHELTTCDVIDHTKDPDPPVIVSSKDRSRNIQDGVSIKSGETGKTGGKSAKSGKSGKSGASSQKKKSDAGRSGKGKAGSGTSTRSGTPENDDEDDEGMVSGKNDKTKPGVTRLAAALTRTEVRGLDCDIKNYMHTLRLRLLLQSE